MSEPMDNVRPPLCESLEWAASKEAARRLETLRWSVDAGWHSEWRATTTLGTPPAWLTAMPFPITELPRPVGDGWSDEG